MQVYDKMHLQKIPRSQLVLIAPTLPMISTVKDVVLETLLLEASKPEARSLIDHMYI